MVNNFLKNGNYKTIKIIKQQQQNEPTNKIISLSIKVTPEFIYKSKLYRSRIQGPRLASVMLRPLSFDG